MNPVPNGIESGKHDMHLKNWVKLQIYCRKNETFFVRKSFYWQRESIMTTMLLFWNWTVFCFFASVWSSKSKNHKKSYEIFSFFVCLCTLLAQNAGSKCVNPISTFLQYILESVCFYKNIYFSTYAKKKIKYDTYSIWNKHLE